MDMEFVEGPLMIRSQKKFPIESPMMTSTEVCALLRIHRSTLYRLTRAGTIPFILIGADYRFDRAKIEDWMKQQYKN
jgi:excisionase family DNA binding protein